MLYMAAGKPAHLGCKFLLDVSVVNSPIVVELLVFIVLFCVVLPAGRLRVIHLVKICPAFLNIHSSIAFPSCV